ncbi:MAG: hypothetical protein GY776_12325 [Alteromonas sp.]|nr:hypothetical protein [Alteromonas sp.]
MNYDEHFNGRCECGEPAIIKADEAFIAHTKLQLIEKLYFVDYCLSCYAKKKANESINRIVEARNE